MMAKEMNWETAENHLKEIRKAYVEIGAAGTFAIVAVLNPLLERFEEGERTEELHQEIMDLEF
jgi:hypothetical protein